MVVFLASYSSSDSKIERAFSLAVCDLIEEVEEGRYKWLKNTHLWRDLNIAKEDSLEVNKNGYSRDFIFKLKREKKYRLLYRLELRMLAFYK